MRKVVLNNGVKIPFSGYGMFQITDLSQCEECVYKAIEIGYRLIDLMVHHEIVPAVNQIEIHPFCQQKESIEFMRRNNIQPESLGPFAEKK